jgi:hypothetical protein
MVKANSAVLLLLLILVAVSSTSASDEYFRVWYRFLKHDGIQAKLSKATAITICDYTDKIGSSSPEVSLEAFKQNAVIHLKSLKKWDQTGLGGEISGSDYEDAANIITHGFLVFKERVSEMRNRNDTKAIYVRTKRGQDWNDSCASEFISFRNEFNDDNECCG